MGRNGTIRGRHPGVQRFGAERVEVRPPEADLGPRLGVRRTARKRGNDHALGRRNEPCSGMRRQTMLVDISDDINGDGPEPLNPLARRSPPVKP